jgi:hypothetical protein
MVLRYSLKRMEAAMMEVMGSIMLRMEALDGPISFNPLKNAVMARVVLIEAMSMAQIQASKLHAI